MCKIRIGLKFPETSTNEGFILTEILMYNVSMTTIQFYASYQ